MENARSTDDIYTIIKNEIIALVIKPGEDLSENSLCKRFGVSRTPIRTVLQKLENRGFLAIEPYKGSFVTLLELSYDRAGYLRPCRHRKHGAAGFHQRALPRRTAWRCNMR